MILNKLDKLIEQLPDKERDIQIGSLYFWFLSPGSVIDIKGRKPEWLKMQVLLLSDEIVNFSKKSEVMIEEIAGFHKDLSVMYKPIKANMTIELLPIDSQFSLKMTSDKTGHILIESTNMSWDRQIDSSVKFKETIDQSYLPEIINAFGKILEY